MAVATTGPALEHVSWFHKPAEDFFRLAEYFDPEAGERTARRTIVRTVPTQRAGFYLVFSFEDGLDNLPEGCVAELTYLLPVVGSDERERSFPLPSERDGRELWIGLTGPDAPTSPEVLVAWQFRLRDAEGRLLAERDSFLWDAE